MPAQVSGAFYAVEPFILKQDHDFGSGRKHHESPVQIDPFFETGP